MIPVETSASAKPYQDVLDDPAAGRNIKARRVSAFNDFDCRRSMPSTAVSSFLLAELLSAYSLVSVEYAPEDHLIRPGASSESRTSAPWTTPSNMLPSK